MSTIEIERGWSVYTEDNKRVGDVVEVHPHYILVSRGLLVVRDLYIPRYAVASAEGRTVRLAITDERLRKMGWTSPPPAPPPPADSPTPRIVPSADEEESASAFSFPVGDSDEETIPDTTLPTTPATEEDPFAAYIESEEQDLDDYDDLGIIYGPTIEVDGEAHLFVQRLGDGSPVVFVHGWGFDRRIWDSLTLDLPRDHTVVTYDARGYGRSTAPWSGYWIERAARDLRVVLKTLDLRDATLVGVDTGAATALEYVLSGGRRAGRLVLIAPTVRNLTTEEGFPDPYRSWQQELRRDRARLATQLAALWAPAATPETQAWLRESILNAAPHALLHSLDMLVAPGIVQPLPELAIPCTIIAGMHDPLVTPEHIQELVDALPGTQLVEIDVPGHLPMLGAPETILEAVRTQIAEE